MFGPVLQGDRVTLRPADDSDPPRFVPWFADMEVTRYLPHRNPLTLRQEEDYLGKAAEDPHRVLWAIVLKEGGKLIGATLLEKIDWRNRDECPPPWKVRTYGKRARSAPTIAIGGTSV